MDFSWTEDQLSYRDKVRTFAAETLDSNLHKEDRDGIFPWQKWRACAEFGLLGLNVPEAHGGQGFDKRTSILALEALGYGCRDNSLPFALNSQLWSVVPAILKFGTDAQKEKFLPPLCKGEIVGAFAITEPETGSDTYAMTARAEMKDGGYILNGHKAYITSAPICGLAVVFAVTDPDAKQWGISAFLVEEDREGFTRTPTREKMGLRSTQMGDLVLENCFVPEENRLGPEGVGMSMFSKAMESERGYIFASQIGRMERQLEEAVTYARGRKAFNQPIGKFQSVSNRIVDMKLRLETARMLLYKVAWLEDQDLPLSMEASLANLHLAECFVESSLDTIRLHGARGYVSEFEIERDLRDGIGGLIYSGTSDIQRSIVAGLMGL